MLLTTKLALATLLAVADAVLSPAHIKGVRHEDLPLRDIFLLAGQSNSVGLGQNSELHGKYAAFPENMLVYPRLYAGGVSPFTDFASFKDNGGPTSINANEQFGPEVSFGFELARRLYNDTLQEAFGLVKVGSMGTSLYEHWNPDGWLQLVEASNVHEATEADASLIARLTQRDTVDTNSSSGNLGGQFIQLVQNANSAMHSKACKEQCRVKALIWIQGETDAEQKNEAQKYEERLEKMVATLRSALGLPELLVLVVQLSSKLPAPGVADVMHAQQKFVKKQGPKLARLVDAEHLSLYEDNVHYDTEGQLDLGKRLASSYIETLQQ